MVIDLFTLIGVVGTAVVVTAYFATQQRWIAAEDWQFPMGQSRRLDHDANFSDYGVEPSCGPHRLLLDRDQPLWISQKRERRN